MTELERTGKLKKAVYEDYRDELISKEEFISYRQNYTAREELLTKQLENLEKTENPQNLSAAYDTPWIHHLLAHREIEQLDRTIVTAMLQEIKVFENKKIKVYYRFSDDTKD